MIARLFSLLLLTSCASSGDDLPQLGRTVRGSHNFGDHVMIYGDHRERFLWGIVFPRDTLVSISSTEVPEPATTIKLRSGITLAFVKNQVTVSKSMNNVTMVLKPQTIYLMHDNLSTMSSADLSGIKLVPKRDWSRWVNDYITTHELVLPENLPMRFGKQVF